MFRLAVIVALVAFAYAARLEKFNPELDGEWQEYMKYHNKQYQYGEELTRYVFPQYIFPIIQTKLIVNTKPD
jgi:hypothetical protein